MNDELEVRYVGELRKLTLEPDDILVLQCDEWLSSEACERIKAQLSEKFGGRSCFVLSGGMKLGAVSGK